MKTKTRVKAGRRKDKVADAPSSGGGGGPKIGW